MDPQFCRLFGYTAILRSNCWDRPKAGHGHGCDHCRFRRHCRHGETDRRWPRHPPNERKWDSGSWCARNRQTKKVSPWSKRDSRLEGHISPELLPPQPRADRISCVCEEDGHAFYLAGGGPWGSAAHYSATRSRVYHGQSNVSWMYVVLSLLGSHCQHRNIFWPRPEDSVGETGGAGIFVR